MNAASPRWRTSLENNLARHAHLPFANFDQPARSESMGRSSWHFTESRMQFRLLGKMQIVISPNDDELVQARHRTWQARTEESRQSFTWPAAGKSLAPSESFARPCPPHAPETFALLVFTPERVERLGLHCQPSERIVYWCENHTWQEEQVNP